MADYFVSKAGNDSTGTGTATNPWLTIGKAIGTGPAITLSGSGTDRLIVGPGTYYESVTLALSPSSGNPFEVVGDPLGTIFAAAGGSVTPGVVEWWSWSDDTTSISTPALDATSKSYVTLRGLAITGGSSGPSTGSAVRLTTCTNWTLTGNCSLSAGVNGSGALVVLGATAGLNLTVDSCDLRCGPPNGSSGVLIQAAETASEYSLGVLVRNVVFTSNGSTASRGVSIARTSNTGLGKLGTGVTIKSCTFAGMNIGVQVYNGVAIALATPIRVEGCMIFGAGAGLTAADTSQVSEDGNFINAVTARTGVSAGTYSTATTRPAVDLFYWWAFGLPAASNMPPFAPPDSSAWKVPAGAGITPPTVDRYGRTRPGTAAYGAVEPIAAVAAASTYIFQTEG